MKNREVLIKLLLQLRSNGIQNSEILKIIEKNPPHYFLSSQDYKFYKKCNIFNDSIHITKLLEVCFKSKKNIGNVLISRFVQGWSLLLMSKISKRVYSLCSSIDQKEKLESYFYKNSITNVYLKFSKEISEWNMIAPFDIIILLDNNNKIDDVKKLLDDNGIVLSPKNF